MLALAFILGGALGNLWDRVTLGYVIDFIEVYYNDLYWPAFNIADSAITIVAIILILDLDMLTVVNYIPSQLQERIRSHIVVVMRGSTQGKNGVKA